MSIRVPVILYTTGVSTFVLIGAKFIKHARVSIESRHSRWEGIVIDTSDNDRLATISVSPVGTPQGVGPFGTTGELGPVEVSIDLPILRLESRLPSGSDAADGRGDPAKTLSPPDSLAITAYVCAQR